MTNFKRIISVIVTAILSVAAAVIALCLVNAAPQAAAAETTQLTNVWKEVPNITRWTYGEYDPEVNKPTATPTYGSADDVVFTFYKVNDDDTLIESSMQTSLDGFRDRYDNNRIPAGRYAMVAELEETAEYTGLKSPVIFNVFPATNRWEQALNIARWTESEEPNLPEGRPKFGTAYYEIRDEEGKALYYSTSAYGVLVDKRSEMKSGWYVLTARVEGNSNYTAIGLNAYRFRVFPASINSWLVTPNIQGWEKGEEPNEPVGRAKYSDGNPVVFTYKKLGADDSTATLDVPEEEGDYVLIATATARGFEELRAEVTFTISSATGALKTNAWSVLPDIDDWTEGGEPNNPVGAAKAGAVMFLYKKADGTPLDTKPTQAGEYILVVTAVANGYEDLTAEVKFTVKEKEVITLINSWGVVPNIQGWVEGNKASDPVGQAAAGIVTFTYKKSDGTVLDEKPLEAGRYIMVATAEADGYETMVAEVVFSVTREVAEETDATWIAGVIILGTLAVVFAAGCIILVFALRRYGLGLKAAFRKNKRVPDNAAVYTMDNINDKG